jgi:hypothetical protein
MMGKKSLNIKFIVVISPCDIMSIDGVCLLVRSFVIQMKSLPAGVGLFGGGNNCGGRGRKRRERPCYDDRHYEDAGYERGLYRRDGKKCDIDEKFWRSFIYSGAIRSNRDA